eukprot:TRINITY_DN23676_c0_g1_i1.p1 TRINITY_DN23676_c0_g1~~TRINITY_DN23676_c0_g1_i1.p1  ORF type:complete len:950 (+),score=213.73 TRINITY_DN23676_c0_g1_i1:84-2852(+)
MFALAAACAAAAAAAAHGGPWGADVLGGEAEGSWLWGQWKQKHGRRYSPEEEPGRLAAFRENRRRAAELARRNPRATFGPNQFSDLHPEEFRRVHASCLSAKGPRHAAALAAATRGSERISATAVRAAAAARPAWDWRAMGAVTPPKNQGQCGGCWAFSTVASLEGAWAAAGRGLPSLSEQLLVSCSNWNLGCEGGNPIIAMMWLLLYRGGSIMSETALPYQSSEGLSPVCPPEMARDLLPTEARMDGFRVFDQDEGQMQAWVSLHGPVAVGIDAGVVQGYHSGVITDCAHYNVSHSVLIVGYAEDYWIIKNSWSAGWGEGGFFRLLKGVNCLGVAGGAAAPIVGSRKPRAIVAYLHNRTDCSDDGYEVPLLLDTCIITQLLLDLPCSTARKDPCVSVRVTEYSGSYSFAVFPDATCSTYPTMQLGLQPSGYCIPADIGNVSGKGYVVAAKLSAVEIKRGTPVAHSVPGKPLTPAPLPPPEPPARGWAVLNCSSGHCTNCTGGDAVTALGQCVYMGVHEGTRLYAYAASCTEVGGLLLHAFNDSRCSVPRSPRGDTPFPVPERTCFPESNYSLMYLCSAKSGALPENGTAPPLANVPPPPQPSAAPTAAAERCQRQAAALHSCCGDQCIEPGGRAADICALAVEGAKCAAPLAALVRCAVPGVWGPLQASCASTCRSVKLSGFGRGINGVYVRSPERRRWGGRAVYRRPHPFAPSGGPQMLWWCARDGQWVVSPAVEYRAARTGAPCRGVARSAVEPASSLGLGPDALRPWSEWRAGDWVEDAAAAVECHDPEPAGWGGPVGPKGRGHPGGGRGRLPAAAVRALRRLVDEAAGYEGAGHVGMGYNGQGYEGASYDGAGYVGTGYDGAEYEGAGAAERRAAPPPPPPAGLLFPGAVCAVALLAAALVLLAKRRAPPAPTYGAC